MSDDGSRTPCHGSPVGRARFPRTHLDKAEKLRGRRVTSFHRTVGRPVCTNPSFIRSPPVDALGDKTTTLSADLHSACRSSLLQARTGGLRMNEGFSHVPVLLKEVVAAVTGTPDLPVIDATLGGAGHAVAILEAIPTRLLVGLDQDEQAIEFARGHLAGFADRVRIHHARFDQIVRIARDDGINPSGASAVLFDLGVSSYQLDTPTRGFSYRSDGPLDMRMDTNSGTTASEYLDHATEDELSALFYVHGETRFSRRIARAVIASRPVRSTSQLAEIVARAVPAAARRRGHPARRVFQALRVAVNSELDVLGPAIDDAVDLLAPGGRLIVLSYHSGEDRIVKNRLRYGETGGCQCPPGLPCVCGATPTLRLLNRGARKASPEEIAANPRAESVRLRIAERLARDERTFRS